MKNQSDKQQWDIVLDSRTVISTTREITLEEARKHALTLPYWHERLFIKKHSKQGLGRVQNFY